MDRQKLGDKMYMGKHLKGSTAKLPQKKSQFLAPLLHSVRDDSSNLNRPESIDHFHRADFLRIENRVSYNPEFKSKKENSDFKAKLQNELMSVRNLLKRIEHVGRLKRTHSLVDDSIEGPESKPPLSAQTKKTKANGKKNSKELVSMFGMENTSSKVFKSCSLLLNKLMKSKVAWVFNNPVDVKSLGLHDYYTIIKHPMDLGTIRKRLDTKFYRAPEEFAEDVRLTFCNAMTYNLEDHDVHKFAKQLLKMFESSWMKIMADYLRLSLNAVNSKVAQVDRSQAGSEEKSSSVIVSAKSLSKPKAKDVNKREMTLEEKQGLSRDLQNLPSDKLEGVLRIIKKRNSSLCQSNDEIEVDIDVVDTETLWELDRYVINCRKGPSKKRSAEVAPNGVVNEPILHGKKQVDCGIEEAKENEAEDNNFSSSTNEREKEGGGKKIVPNGSSSSSSDSGSSSSGSDTCSSSA